MMKSYVLREDVPLEARADLRAYPELLQNLLFHRGIRQADQAEAFLNPDWQAHVHDPYLMKDMDKAVERVLRAIGTNEKVIVYTDYDADGIPAGVIFHDFFKKIGFGNFENYFPHRHEEGYGLNGGAVSKFKEAGVSLIITADCGIADVASVKQANESGIDVIITDHHVAQEELPPAYAILNPKQPGCTYPYNMLCGSGVAFKLIQAILQKDQFGMKEGMEKWLLDMVGLATMADMVPLQDENRIFAHYGLTVLRKSPRLGLMKLLRKIKVDQRHLSEDDIGFMLVPRINAASRMGLPIDAFRLLTASDEIEADQVSDHLNKINDERKGMAAAIAKDVKKHLRERLDKTEGNNVLVIGNPNWRPAILGPVASNIADEYGVPVFLWGRADGEMIKGSCRSGGEISLVELMQNVASGVLAGFGGHRASGGFSITHDKIHLLEDELNRAYQKIMSAPSNEQAKPEGRPLDGKLSIDNVNWDTYRVIEKLAPFGEGNPKPAFLFEKVTIASLKRFGKEKNHLELQFDRQGDRPVSAIGFFLTEDSFEKKLEKGGQIDLVATMEKSFFRNFPELRLRIVDVL